MRLLRYHLDLVRVVHFDLSPIVLEDHRAGDSNDLALEVTSRIINFRFGEFCLPCLRDSHCELGYDRPPNTREAVNRGKTTNPF